MLTEKTKYIIFWQRFPRLSEKCKVILESFMQLYNLCIFEVMNLDIILQHTNRFILFWKNALMLWKQHTHKICFVLLEKGVYVNLK